MIRTPRDLSRPANTFIDRQGIFLSLAIMSVYGTIHTWIDPSSSNIYKYGMVIITLVFIGLGIFRFFDFSRINARPMLFLSIYSIIGFIGLVYMTELSTPYVILWVPLVLVANLFYGTRGVWWTINILGFITIAKFAYALSIDASTADLLGVISAWFAAASVTLFYVSIQKVFEADHEELKRTYIEVKQQEQRLQALINNMTESVLVLDGEYRVTLYNAAALGLLDTNATITGKKLTDILRLEDAKKQVIDPSALIKNLNQATTRQDLYLVYSENDRAALSTTFTPIRTAFGETMQDGYIVTMRDITREKSLEEERDEFISVISHELRTPVTITEANISNAIVMQEKAPEPAKVTKALNAAHDQVMYLANMLNDLTTFARAERGDLKLNGEHIAITALMQDIVGAYQKQAATKNLGLELKLDQSVPEDFVSNPLYIREILQNFIVNAIKYSDTGTITVSVRGSGDSVRFDVTDQGIGISTSDQQKVFNKFFRSEDYRTRSTSGTGLGLYIVRKLANVLHGKLELTSEIGKGSTFSLIVPDQKVITTAKPLDTAKPA